MKHQQTDAPRFPIPASRFPTAWLLLALTLGPGLCSPVAAASAPLATTLDAEAQAWVDRTLTSLTLEQKVAQLVFVRTYGTHEHPDSYTARAARAEVAELGVGGLVVFASELETVPRVLNELQSVARVPLLVAADVERGLGFRVECGAVPLPSAMALGAIGTEKAARFAGEVTARESRAIGIHWAFAPVADVNNNPANPVIHTRSFGEDPDAVARLTAAFVRGLRDGGALSTAKHFPGHGDTNVDSHVALPVVSGDRDRFEAVEWKPFRAAIEAGVDSIMVGHLAVPNLDPSGAPASLSAAASGDLIRDELGFEGLIVTDALEMRGVQAAWSGDAVIRAAQAGADVILMPDDSRVAIQALVRAVKEGQLTEAQVAASARRVLEAKARVGLHREHQIDRTEPLRDVARPSDVAQALELARQSVTLVNNNGEILPLAAELDLRLLHLDLTDRRNDALLPGLVGAELQRRRIPTIRRTVGAELSAASIKELVSLVGDRTHVIVSAFVRVSPSPDRPALDPSQRELLEQLVATGTPVIVIALESPYLLSELPPVAATLCTYGATRAAQQAATEIILGEAASRGQLPVSLPGVAPFGAGIATSRRAMGLERAAPETVGFGPEAMAEVDAVIDDFLGRGAFPGGVVAVGRHGKLVHLRAFGKMSTLADAAPVETDTIYDLASLTKVIVTTTAAMVLVDSGRLDLDARVQAFLPKFVGPNKDQVTVRHLLTHSSGIDWWAPLFQEVQGKEAYLERIQAMELVAEPGEQMLYSDLGIILLGEIIERVAGEPFETFVARRVLKPLGMNDTRYNPPAELLPRIAPTEVDTTWRNRLVHGEVHDENAAALGGVAPHAGLFGTAPDLARFAQMLLYRGVFEHHRSVSRATVELFTRPAGVVPGSSRALGWDTKSPTGSSAGTRFSDTSFGHTGFTGTSLWIDPERDLFLILLTNRVHPTRENRMIIQARAAIADAVVNGIKRDRGPGTRDQGQGPEKSGSLSPVPGTRSPVPPVLSGLDRVAAGETSLLRGKRLGLIVHPASVTVDGRHALDVFRDQGLDVRRIFAPEHGLRGAAAAGEKVEDGRDETTGLPVISLYGAKRKPDAADLEDLDALVFDLQDVGVRFYTYASTLILALEASAEAGLPLILLDRPNPLGGELIAGPLAAPREVVPASFVNMAPGPLVHGLTLGEMARFVAARLDPQPQLEVVAMKGWSRSMRWADTARAWVPPSPNLRTAEAALLYPGTALLEATNVSEGRGTDAPFQLIGAPWLDPAALVFDAAAVHATPTDFTPAALPGAGAPKHHQQVCRGVRLEVVDASRLDPYRLGLELLTQLRQQPELTWTRDGALTWLLGTPAPFVALEAGTPVETIVAVDRAAHEAWRVEREPALLYD